jgi:hypothetical protein
MANLFVYSCRRYVSCAMKNEPTAGARLCYKQQGRNKNWLECLEEIKLTDKPWTQAMREQQCKHIGIQKVRAYIMVKRKHIREFLR